MKRLACSLMLCISLVAAPKAFANDPVGLSLSGITFGEGCCLICQGASYSPACSLCVIWLMWTAVDGWD